MCHADGLGISFRHLLMDLSNAWIQRVKKCHSLLLFSVEPVRDLRFPHVRIPASASRALPALGGHHARGAVGDDGRAISPLRSLRESPFAPIPYRIAAVRATQLSLNDPDLCALAGHQRSMR